MDTLPPRPPSPPLGPPRGTNFSRPNARHPLPPSPAFTLILTSSINMLRKMEKGPRGYNRRPLVLFGRPEKRLSFRFDADKLTQPAAVAKFNDAGDTGEQ